jgi:hypothetical protein
MATIASIGQLVSVTDRKDDGDWLFEFAWVTSNSISLALSSLYLIYACLNVA